MFYGTGKRKSFANRPQHCQLGRLALRQCGARGWPAPPAPPCSPLLPPASPAPSTQFGWRLWGSGARAVPKSQSFARTMGFKQEAAGLRCRASGSLHPQECRGKLRQERNPGAGTTIYVLQRAGSPGLASPLSTKEAGTRHGPLSPLRGEPRGELGFWPPMKVLFPSPTYF